MIHLAAQAGVRYSLKKPLAYVEANLRCFVTMLEAVQGRQQAVPSRTRRRRRVYGTNKVIPFSEKHQVDSQASLYGATKKANENIAHVYHSLHGLRLTRPALLRPCTARSAGQTWPTLRLHAGDPRAPIKHITEFRNADGTERERDFASTPPRARALPRVVRRLRVKLRRAEAARRCARPEVPEARSGQRFLARLEAADCTASVAVCQ